MPEPQEAAALPAAVVCEVSKDKTAKINIAPKNSMPPYQQEVD